MALMMGAGCDVSKLAISGPDTKPSVSASDIRLTAEDLSSRLSLNLEDSSVRVGQREDTVLAGPFKKPPRGTFLREMPPGMDDSFSIQGWETFDRTFSAVSKDQSVILAVYTTEAKAVDSFGSTLKDATARFGMPLDNVSTTGAEYVFWEDGTNRLMLCLYKGKGEETFTQALGLSRVMDSLRMDPGSARKDAAVSSARLFERQPATKSPE